MRDKIIKITFFIIFALLIYCWFENNILQISTYSISNEKISSEIDGFKIMQISDFHNTNSKILTKSLIKQIKKEQPDIIVITGDLIDSNNTNVKIATNFINQIKNVAQIYYITGNHEIASLEYSSLKEELIKNNVIVLENQTKKIPFKTNKLYISGIDDPLIGCTTCESDKETTQNELDKLNIDTNSFNILLAHRPEQFELYQKYNYDLILSGHAHGGQIRIPFIGGLYAPHQGWFPTYTNGQYINNNSVMIVNRGIGNSRFPLRLNNRPELTIITLHSTTEGDSNGNSIQNNKRTT